MLSEFTGASLELDPALARRAVRAMVKRVQRNDVHAWLNGQLAAIDAEA